MFLRVGARSLRVFEHECRVKSYLAHQAQCLPVVFFCLAVEAAEYIRSDGCFRYDTSYGRDALQIPFPRVTPVHQFQYPVATALYGQMNELTEVVVSGYGLQGAVAHILRVTGGEAYPHLWNRFCHAGQQVGKGQLFETVRIDILA